MESHRISNIDAIFNFVLGGIAIFTLINRATGVSFTYRVVAKEVAQGRTLFFVSVLTGTNNESDYAFLGTIFDDGIFRHGKRSSISSDAKSSLAFAWLMRRLENHADLDTVEVWHEGKCGRCGRKLTTVESLETGFGPVCITKLAM